MYNSSGKYPPIAYKQFVNYIVEYDEERVPFCTHEGSLHGESAICIRETRQRTKKERERVAHVRGGLLLLNMVSAI